MLSRTDQAYIGFHLIRRRGGLYFPGGAQLDDGDDILAHPRLWCTDSPHVLGSGSQSAPSEAPTGSAALRHCPLPACGAPDQRERTSACRELTKLASTHQELLEEASTTRAPAQHQLSHHLLALQPVLGQPVEGPLHRHEGAVGGEDGSAGSDQGSGGHASTLQQEVIERHCTGARRQADATSQCR